MLLYGRRFSEAWIANIYLAPYIELFRRSCCSDSNAVWRGGILPHVTAMYVVTATDPLREIVSIAGRRIGIVDIAASLNRVDP